MEDSISLRTSKLIRDKDGYPVFLDTKADLRYVDKSMTIEEANKNVINCFMNCAETNKELAWKIIDQRLDPMKYAYVGKRFTNNKK
jgi:hypothetical protein